VFSGQLFEHLHDDNYRSLQLALTLRPEQGALIPGSGGLRKLRWALRGKGKRGGLRIIYYWDSAEDVIYLIYLLREEPAGEPQARSTQATEADDRGGFE
jgi:mRNA-degrading endonuclease RelE of RelBE toxin-antitoxin system